MVERKFKDTLINLVSGHFNERNIEVDKIIVFGSYVSGEATDESDLDVIVVSPAFNGVGLFPRVKQMAGIHWELVKVLKMPVDIVYYSSIEWENSDKLIIREAKRYGEVIYDAAAA